MEGLILKATGGFYYVADGGELIACRARGLFRKEKISPLVGDRVEVDLTDAQEGYIMRIFPRKNVLVRPPLANLDHFVLIASVADPAPNPLVLDKLMAIAIYQNIQPMLVITKSDLGATDSLEEIYRAAGMPVFAVSLDNDSELDRLRAALGQGISAFSGNSGVGKSSLLNRLDVRLTLATGETSQKLGRGRHTTRHVELFPIGSNGYIADTPGFSAVDMERCEPIRKEALAGCFPEFADFTEKCRFTGCSHTVEKGCAVLAALAEGTIHPSRHTSYCVLYEQAKKRPNWETRENP